ncbi:MAG: sulfatase-like hydrolase/transferase [Planctomycetes bacterium]|nr:sulfatase-like hydrolase/transferase [Planctomycetota bacterium]
MNALVRLTTITLTFLGASTAQDHERPNIVVIVSDDQGWADIGYHNPRVYSPRLDALAGEGARFAQAYSMPQCTPTRVALLTGRYPGRFGGAALEASNDPAIPLGTATLATVLHARGYSTHLAGKWHLGSTPGHGPNEFGFDTSYGSLAGAVGMYDHRYRRGPFEQTWHRDGTPIDGAENGVHATDLVAAEAIRVIEEPHERPFFLYVPFQSVHTPLDERGRFVDRPTQPDPEDPSRWLDEDEIEWFHDPAGVIQRERDPEKRLLLAAVHHLDAAVGRIVDALERRGLRERTLLVFTSDNGPQGVWPGNAYPDDLKLTDFNQPLPMRGKKTDVWEGGIHVPAFASWPGHIPARTIDTPVHVVDWLPTIATLVGADLPPDGDTPPALDGLDLGPLLRDGTPLPDRDLYWIWSRRTNRWALRRGDWKIVHYGRDEPGDATAWELFDLAADPREATDVAARHPEVVAALHAGFLAQRARDRR